jgi:hypothetical protein
LKLQGSAPEASTPTPALTFFHIPIPEYESVLKDSSKVLGDKYEAVLSPLLNSGFFTALLQAGDVRATFAGHDHTNDYCGELMGIHLCYGGGVMDMVISCHFCLINFGSLSSNLLRY